MSFLPKYRPQKLSLGFLEQEILEIIWDLGCASAKDIHDRILADPDRELAYASVMTVLQRLTKKGWLTHKKKGRAFFWYPLISREQAQAVQSYEQLHNFLAISNPEVVASFADSLDTASIEQIEAIATRLAEVRKQRGEKQ
ncbi:BlaI/MecI/CopY family transcriptional regulator [Cyanobacterium aponinum UTEX 3222]|uniref:Transcriptional repressor, CopY family n=2 Tax=Cyanobacterium aponinum TaxID=379064 RepID=K9Z3Q9_CYAAP|nr:BlaI/MecI/CopY family transcriptional regulator [Cyanobacterium aponinum]WRL41748.1 BlaI/MecI/CopY family transcriptional regulator [Cyanobacterium aponinum UTEX 3222]AFZ53382.1 transcriptional repressor, CopY family [Cyanobacterium aponinum PCC 10605]MBD2395752.1 BlaI/MecI/CopY family transcriptional regulator [Cyanobacterium aponinum FACHB-4101]PHV62937.1 CopY family transcriptional regulator [Cyanobacterium aponinum IPPAS B-1201]WPF90126.1 BlaI/MecI/CopY family transcriptional regulator 